MADYFFDEDEESNEDIEVKDDGYNYKGYFVENEEEEEKKCKQKCPPSWMTVNLPKPPSLSVTSESMMIAPAGNTLFTVVPSSRTGITASLKTVMPLITIPGTMPWISCMSNVAPR